MSQDAKIRTVTVYLPGGGELVIPGANAMCGFLQNGALFIDEELDDGGKRRFIGLPHAITMDPPPSVQLVGALPPALRRS